MRIWSSDSKENARFIAANVKNRDLSRETEKITICREKLLKFRFVAENGKIAISNMPRLPFVLVQV